MTSYEMHRGSTGGLGSKSNGDDETNGRLNGYFTCILGINCVQLFCGIASIALGIANAIICGQFGALGYGIWGGIINLAVGISGIMTYVRRTRCNVGTQMILSILAASAAAVQLGFGAGAAVNDYAGMKIASKYNTNDLNVFLWNKHDALDYMLIFGCSDTQRSSYWTWQATGPTVTDALLASFGVLQGIFAILTAVYSCRICVCPPGVSLIAGHQTYSSQMTIVTKA